MNSLSEDLSMDRTTLTRSLRVLLKEKLVKNVKSDDARKRIVKLTDKGYSLVGKAIPLWKEAEDEILNESKSTIFRFFKLGSANVFLISSFSFGGIKNLWFSS